MYTTTNKDLNCLHVFYRSLTILVLSHIHKTADDHSGPSPFADGYKPLINAFYGKKKKGHVFTCDSLFPLLHYKTHSNCKFPHISLWPISHWDATSVLKKKGNRWFSCMCTHTLASCISAAARGLTPAETWQTSALLRRTEPRGMFF